MFARILAVLILPSQVADVRMRMFNADGSEAEMCGNGIRCVAKNQAVRAMLGEALGQEVRLPEHPQLMGAYVV